MRFFIAFLFAACASAQAVTDLWSRGFSVIPTPQSVQLAPGDIVVDDTWAVEGSPGIALTTLVQDAGEFHGLRLKTGNAQRRIRLVVSSGSAANAFPELAKQAYRLRIDDSLVEVSGNTPQGLFYGVQTLVQLLKRNPSGRLTLPRGTIEDWPKVELRFLHWDTKHHQDRMETLKRYLDWSARLKINMIGFELEDKFEYPSHPVIGAPGAFTTAELQEIVNYGLERYIQVVPEIQAPAHLAYVLKHPEFKDLRADGNNYMSALCNPRTYDLIFSMFDDVINATKGVDYFFASTDEVYYAGIDCAKPYNPENRSLAWVEFVRRAHDHLKQRGRRMLIWAEYPLLTEHVKMLPPDVIDGVIGDPEYLEWEKKLGMRQLAYTSVQGEEKFFPSNFSLGGKRKGNLEGVYEYLTRNGRHLNANPIGVFGAGWDDSGLHNETFWLGWSTVAQYGWNSAGPPLDQHVAEFMNLYYGPRTQGMIDVYTLMQEQGRAWEATWDRVISRVRGPGYGNSYGPKIGTERHDMTLSALPLPEASDLSVKPFFAEKYANFISIARERMADNERALMLLESNFPRADRNRYNLEVYVALARFMGHHWRLLTGLADAESQLVKAQDAARDKQPQKAVDFLVLAANSVNALRKEDQDTLAQLTAVFEKSRYPKGRSVNGKNFVHVLDDTKDHWADRTADLGYMNAPEQSIGLDAWNRKLGQVLQEFANRNGVRVKGLGDARFDAGE
jgi:hexosaminidase